MHTLSPWHILLIFYVALFWLVNLRFRDRFHWIVSNVMVLVSCFTIGLSARYFYNTALFFFAISVIPLLALKRAFHVRKEDPRPYVRLEVRYEVVVALFIFLISFSTSMILLDTQYRFASYLLGIPAVMSVWAIYRRNEVGG